MGGGPESATAVAVGLGAGEAIEMCAAWRCGPDRRGVAAEPAPGEPGRVARTPGASPPGAAMAWRDRRQPWLSGRAAPSGRDRVVDMTAARMCNRGLRIVF